MTRAFPNPQQEPQGNSRGDWGNLRSELMALLDEVETQVANRPAPDPVPRLGDIRQQAPRRETTLPPNPRDSLESAIRQIRSSQAAPRRIAEQQPLPPLPEVRPSEIAASVGGVTERLERLEGELKSSARGTTANVKEIAEQVAQLSHVVEVLAGAVGEAGQVKRLESQIAGLAKMLSDGPRMDVEALSNRLDDLSGTVATLADMQRDFAERMVGNDVGSRLEGLAAAIDRIAAAQSETGRPDPALARRVDEISASVDKLSEIQLRQMQRADDVDMRQRLDDVSAMIGRMVELQRAQSDRIDRIGIPDRLDDVSATVGRLADLQVQVANRLESRKDGPLRDSIAKLGTDLDSGIGSLEQSFRDAIATLDSGLKQTAGSIDGGLKGGLSGIEDSVRAIYDRIDAIEKSVAMTPAEVEKLTEELAAISTAIADPKAPAALVAMVESLTRRMAAADGRNEEVGKLKAEIEGLRKAVLGTLEPRFTSLEQQLETLSDSVLRRLQDPDPALGNVEAQVRQLVARMDQTGEQLSGLARLYQQPAEQQAMPDLSDLAELVAQRTSDALAKLDASKTVTVPGIDEAGFAEIERRVERVVKAAVEDGPSDDFTALQSTIREVNDRLARLESSLQDEARATAAGKPPAQPSMASFAAAIDVTDEAAGAELASPAADPIANLLADAAAVIDVPPPAPPRETVHDAMPADPSTDGPLKDKPFPDPEPQPAAWQSPRQRHPGLAEDRAAPGTAAAPRFDPNRAERPPQPRSSLDAVEETVAEPGRKEPTTSRNTFIEAHRRAARRTSPSVSAPVGQNSLIARALSRFQAGPAKPEAAAVAAELEVVAEAPSKAAKSAKPAKVEKPRVRRLAGDKEWPAPVEPVAETVASLESLEPLVADPSDAPVEPVRESFLVRHRRPILLGLAIIAIACLTINFLAQRLSEHDQPAAKPQVAPAVAPAPATTTVGDAALSPQPMAQQNIDPVTTASPGPRVIPTSASLVTAPADPGAAASFTPAGQAVVPPTTLTLPPDAAAAPAAPPAALAMVDPTQPTPAVAATTGALESPLKVEMPPDGIGPQPLREAAANGDARAQFEIAAIYTEGRAVPQDMKAAAVWYERAAAQGFAPAQYRLGSLYESGQGVDKDLDSARLWYQRAAEAGNRMAMHNLAALYAGGGLGKQEFDTAAKWFGEAADRGLKDSEFNLGMLYARGLGVTQDLAQSYKWFSLAALKGDTDAAKARDDIGASLDAATVARVKAEVAAWKPAAIDLVANFAPIGTWSKDFDPGQPISKPEVVKSVQAALVQLGYDVGTPDGVMGPKTADAIKDFEQKTGMSQSGAINPRLLAVLGSQPV